MKIDYSKIPVLAVGFTRSTSLFAKAIQLVRGILNDKAMPNHAFLVTCDRGQLFATEETLDGLEERSLEEYAKEGNRIVAMYYWQLWTVEKREDALNYLAEIRRRKTEESRYDWKGLLWFLNKRVKPDPKRQWCSENCASMLKKYGASWIGDTHLAPDELLKLMQKSGECEAVLGYYK